MAGKANQPNGRGVSLVRQVRNEIQQTQTGEIPIQFQQHQLLHRYSPRTQLPWVDRRCCSAHLDLFAEYHLQKVPWEAGEWARVVREKGSGKGKREGARDSLPARRRHPRVLIYMWCS